MLKLEQFFFIWNFASTAATFREFGLVVPTL
jgi:hypothetical protein